MEQILPPELQRRIIEFHHCKFCFLLKKQCVDCNPKYNKKFTMYMKKIEPILRHPESDFWFKDVNVSDFLILNYGFIEQNSFKFSGQSLTKILIFLNVNPFAKDYYFIGKLLSHICRAVGILKPFLDIDEIIAKTRKLAIQQDLLKDIWF